MEPGFTITVNGVARDVPAEPARSLLEVLREELGVTGPKLGCGEDECGACTVLLGRRAVTACITPVAEAAGHQVTTVEGLAEDGVLHPVQQAWMETGAMQCGYCTPGRLAGCAALLARVPHPDDARIDAELAGHLCRCCGYPRIRAAVHRAADLMEQPESLEPVPVPLADPAIAAGAAGRPWDLVAPDPEAFLAGLPEGLVAVAERDPVPGVMATSSRAWLHVGLDGVVTAFTGKVEAGPMYTAQQSAYAAVAKAKAAQQTMQANAPGPKPPPGSKPPTAEQQAAAARAATAYGDATTDLKNATTQFHNAVKDYQSAATSPCCCRRAGRGYRWTGGKARGRRRWRRTRPPTWPSRSGPRPGTSSPG